MADPSTSATATEPRPTGGRKGNRVDEGLPVVGDKAAGIVPTSGLQTPGETKGSEEKESLKIKIHLNIHAKVRLDLDARIYGDVVIGLL